MAELFFESEIQASAERVFSLLVELRDYDRWLPRSSAFHGTNKISDGPIKVGTTYVEPGPFGTRHGIVTRLIPPTHLDFEQPMTLRPRFLGVIGIKLFHRLTPGGDHVHVFRRLELLPKGTIKLAMPLVVSAFRSENERMMETLKAFAESEEDES
jgi:uncharacterized protein YndB with AHSA1/START domain